MLSSYSVFHGDTFNDCAFWYFYRFHLVFLTSDNGDFQNLPKGSQNQLQIVTETTAPLNKWYCREFYLPGGEPWRYSIAPITALRAIKSAFATPGEWSGAHVAPHALGILKALNQLFQAYTGNSFINYDLGGCYVSWKCWKNLRSWVIWMVGACNS